ncbi:MAG TPA: ABATE domain-containing protein [Stellaceae bacterium]|nr:ABATE domain-containing protein [Stellaceae bacterium]
MRGSPARRTEPLSGAESRAGRLHLIAGRLCLNFANTASGRGMERALEHLVSYDTLLDWAVHSGILGSEDAAALAALAVRQPAAAREVLSQAIALRETIYRLFTAIAERRAPAASDIAAFNEWLARVLPYMRVAAADSGFDWRWAEPRRALDSPLWPIVRSAAETLTEAPHDRIRQCPGHDCGWLFLDSSKSGRRRWCDMNVCGNRSKARQHYRRVKAAAGLA